MEEFPLLRNVPGLKNSAIWALVAMELEREAEVEANSDAAAAPPFSEVMAVFPPEESYSVAAAFGADTVFDCEGSEPSGFSEED